MAVSKYRNRSFDVTTSREMMNSFPKLCTRASASKSEEAGLTHARFN